MIDLAETYSLMVELEKFREEVCTLLGVDEAVRDEYVLACLKEALSERKTA